MEDLEEMFIVANTLFVIMVLTSLYYGWRANKRLSVPRSLLLFYSLWVILSVIWAWDKMATIGDIKRQIIYIFLWMSIANILKLKDTFIKTILKWVMVAGVCLTLFLIIYYGPLEYIQGVLQGNRMGEDLVQLNKIGMYTASSCIIAYNLYLEKRNPQYLLLFLASFLGMLGCASKRAFLMLVVSLVISKFLEFKDRKLKNKIIKGFIFLFLIYITVVFASELEIFKGILGRFEEFYILFETQDSHFSRFRYIKYGVESFLENPIIGLGSGNSHIVTLKAMGRATYLHNNYLEQLVNLGIIGFTIYYSIYVVLLKKLIFQARKGFICSKIVAVLLMSQLISDIAVTSYNQKFTYILFAIAIGTIETRNFERK